MDNQPILSLCIPTNGAVQWVLQVLDSIYNQNYDLTKFEVVITDNGKDSQLGSHIKDYNFPNLRYIPTTDEGFLNLVTSLKEGQGLFCKMINHRSVLKPGTIEKMVELVERYKESKPIIFCSDGNVKGAEVVECKNLDQFIANLSYWASWSGGIGFWKNDLSQFDDIKLDELFPNTSLLLYIRDNSQCVIWNEKFECMADDAGKGGYDLYSTFAVHFLDIIKELLDDGRICKDTFEKVRGELFVFLTQLYKDEVILPTKHTFLLRNIRNSMNVYYGNKGYYKMVITAFFNVLEDYYYSLIRKLFK